MVRCEWQTIKGKRLYVEIKPERCPNGHTELGVGWGQCPEPGCREMGRTWPCWVPGCGEVLFDDEHVHRGGPLPSSALRGA